jgi:biofilm PGA synthesis N-glycosyltransferase PgaC
MIYLAIICLLLLLYSYVGFPLLVSVLASIRPRKWTIDRSYQPAISIILPAYNEELVLRRCLTALVQQDYPSDKLEILCGSDGSSDNTNTILREFADLYPNVKPYLFETQRGKMFVLNDLVQFAKNEILFFTDADVTLSANTIRCHAAHYAGEQVGGVTGRLELALSSQNGAAVSESWFLDSENELRRKEALVYSTTGFYGCNWSMRKSVWRDLPSQRTCDDMFAYLAVIAQNKRLVFDEGAVATELYGRGYEDEFSRKSRYAARTLNAISYFPSLLIKWPSAFFLWPRKLMRWFTFVPVLLIIIASLIGYAQKESWSYGALAIEGLGLMLTLIGWASRNSKRSVPVASQLYWFYKMNLAFILGIYEYLFSKQRVLWSQTKRVGDMTYFSSDAVATKEAV